MRQDFLRRHSLPDTGSNYNQAKWEVQLVTSMVETMLLALVTASVTLDNSYKFDKSSILLLFPVIFHTSS